MNAAAPYTPSSTERGPLNESTTPPMIHWHLTTPFLQFRLVGNGAFRRVEFRARKPVPGDHYVTLVEWSTE